MHSNTGYRPNLEGRSKPLLTFRKWALAIVQHLLEVGTFLEIDKVQNSLFDVLTIGHLLVLFITLILVFQSSREDKSVLTLSLHQYNNYPSEKPPSTIDIHLRDGTGDEEYLLKELREACHVAIEGFARTC